MKFLSVCSGIEAASVAWNPLGWKAVAFSEIEPFPCAVLAHHYPETPNWGDMTKYKEWPDVSIDLLCGGTPCQSFSVAGLRKGLDDPRGNLMLTFGAIAAKYRPQWLVWENVPGVLSSNGGADFGAFLGMLGQLGYGFAYRVLDAQYFGVAQRRRRVFVVGCLGDWRSAAAVLFERHSLSGNPAPRRQAGKGFAADAAPCLTGSGSGRGVERTGETRGQDPVVAVAHVDVMPTVRAGASNGGAGHGARSGDSKDELIVPVRTLCIATGQAGAEIGADMAPTGYAPGAVHRLP
jgi:DNA (cytosine-5)-methyltransferase 1